MASEFRIDTLKFARRLTEAGMDPRHAEAIVDGLSDADTSDLATKTDIAEVRAEIADLRGELRTGLAELRGELFRAMLIQSGTTVGLTVGLTVALVKLLP